MASFFRIFLLALVVLATPAAARDMRTGGKLVLTGGISSIDGAAGGGLATWAVIAGSETEDGHGATAHATLVALPDFDVESYGVAVGLRDRVELSYAHQSFDTRGSGAALGLGRGFIFAQDVIGAKLRVVGDAVWAQDTLMPQVSIGLQHKIADKAAIIHAVGGRQSSGTDVYVTATKLFLAQGIVANATARFTKANQFGLLGFGGDRGNYRTIQAEASLAKLLSPSIAIGAEFRSKPDNLGFAQEDDSIDLFVAWAVDRHATITAAYVDLGDIATVARQRGLFLSLQAGF